MLFIFVKKFLVLLAQLVKIIKKNNEKNKEKKILFL